MYLKHDTFTFPSLCYKAEILKSTRPRSNLYGNADDFGLEIDIAKHGKVCELQDKFVHYRRHNCQDRRPRSIQQRINMAKKYADHLLTGDDESKTVFCKYIHEIKTYDRVLYYFLVSKYHRVLPKIDSIFKKNGNKRKFRRLKRRMLFHGLIFYLTKKIPFLPSKKYAYKYTKAKKKFLTESRDYKIAMNYLQSEPDQNKKNICFKIFSFNSRR